MPPIFLKHSVAAQSADDSGTLIVKRSFPIYHPGPYTKDLLPHDKKPLEKLDYVAPLGYYCIKCLYSNVDELDLGGVPRILYGANTQDQPRLMKTLIPFFDQHMRRSQMEYMDPRLWATLIQLFAHLPPVFKSYTLPLSDMYLLLLQNITPSIDFTLVTVLDLSCEPSLTDSTIGQLKPLTNLCVLDISGTKVGTWGIKQLSMCLTQDESSGVRFGFWELRIWSMKDCKRIRNDVKPILQTFPLLTLVDLRGTSVTESSLLNFESCPSPQLQRCYYPHASITWIDTLWTLHSKELFRCWTESPYILHVDSLEHPQPAMNRGYPRNLHRTTVVSEDDKVLVLPSNKRETASVVSEVKLTHPQSCRSSQSAWRRPLKRGDSECFSDVYVHEGEGNEQSSECYDDDDEEEEEEGWSSDEDEWSEKTSDVQEQVWTSFSENLCANLNAREFYTSTDSFDVDDNGGEEELGHGGCAQNYPPIMDKKQLNFMFFRHPPSFHRIDSSRSAVIPNGLPLSAHKKKLIDDASRKKTKTTRASFTQALLNTVTSGTETCGKPEAKNCDSASVKTSTPKNPFRAKKEIQGTVMELDRAPKQSIVKSSYTPKGFDMKAWTTKVKK